MDCTMWSLYTLSLLLALTAPVLCQDNSEGEAGAAAGGNNGENGQVVNMYSTPASEAGAAAAVAGGNDEENAQVVKVFSTPTNPPSTTMPDQVPTTTPPYVVRNFTGPPTEKVVVIIPTKPVDYPGKGSDDDHILFTNPPTKPPGKGDGGDGGKNDIDKDKTNGGSHILLDSVFLALSLTLGFCLRLWT